MRRYDLIVLGGGAGGLVAAAGAASMGARVALVDKRLGGDCLWTGCIPTKSLIHSSKLVHTARRAQRFGVAITGTPSFEEAKKGLDRAISTIQKHDDPERFRAMGIDVYESYGMFAGPHKVQIEDGDVIHGKRIVIATGSRPMVPPIPGLKAAGFLTNESALELSVQPRSLLVVGGGPIGLELAQSFARFGSEVIVVEMAQELLMKEDQELVSYVKQALEADGIYFLTGAKVTRIEQENHMKIVMVEHGGKEERFEVEQILIASGRQANTDRLNLEQIGVKTERGFVVVNDRLQTNLPHIYAVGDVNGLFPFTHAAGYEGKLAVSNAVFGLRRKVSYKNLPWVTFTDPELFHLGLTEEEAKKSNGAIRVYRTRLHETDRFVTDDEAAGLVKIITDAKGYIIGAHAVGPNAGDFMQEVVFAKHHGHKIGSISHVIHPYPTKTGAVQRTADLYWRDKLFAGWVPKLLQAYLRWFR